MRNAFNLSRPRNKREPYIKNTSQVKKLDPIKILHKMLILVVNHTDDFF